MMAWEDGGTAQAMADSSHMDSPVSNMMTVLVPPLSTEDHRLRWFSLAHFHESFRSISKNAYISSNWVKMDRRNPTLLRGMETEDKPQPCRKPGTGGQGSLPDGTWHGLVGMNTMELTMSDA